MRFRIIKPTTLLAAPTWAASILMLLDAETIVNSAGDKIDQWIHVRVSGLVSEQEGWIRSNHCEEIPDDPQPEISQEYFVHECFMADRWFAKDPVIASSAASAEFLMARAIIETDIRNAEPLMVDSDAVGPFQISSAEWAGFLDESEGLASGLNLADRNKLEFGTYCAAWRMRNDARVITNFRQESGGFTDTLFGPTDLDLFQAYVLDNPLAAVAVLGSVESDNDKPMDELLRRFMKPNEVDDLFAKRGRFLGTAGQPKTVGEFVTITNFALNDALKRASELDQAYGPISEMMAKRRAADATGVDGGRAEARSDTTADEFENFVVQGVPPGEIEEVVRGAEGRSPLEITRERQLDGSYKRTVRLPKRDFNGLVGRPKAFPDSFDLDGAGSGSGADNELFRAPPDTAPPKGLPAETKPDIVDVSVFGPQSLRASGQCLIQVFLHTPDQAGVSLTAAKEIDAAAGRRAVKTLLTEIARGARVTAILEGRGLTVDQAKQDIVWRGNPTSCEFTVSAPTNSAGNTFYPRILLLMNSAPVGSVTFALSATSEEQPVTNEVRGEQARRYSNAFLSYASENRAEVLKRAQGLQAAHIDFFQDLLDLKPGERWERKLYEKIDSCDLFLLFWSTEAKNSPWVMKEVEYALNRQKLSPDQLPDITPVIIEGPPPPKPPDSMRDIHFNDSLMYVLAAVQAQPPRPPKLG